MGLDKTVWTEQIITSVRSLSTSELMNQYRHTQIGYLLIILYGGVVVFIGYLNVLTGFSNPFALAALIVLLLILKLFSSLTVTVDDKRIKIRFGLGVVPKVFQLKDIESYAVVKKSLVLRLGD